MGVAGSASYDVAGPAGTRWRPRSELLGLLLEQMAPSGWVGKVVREGRRLVASELRHRVGHLTHAAGVAVGARPH